jgi:hypothetical protein
MKAIVERLSAEGILCKKFTSIPLKLLGSRKQIDCYLGVDLKGYYCSVWVLHKRSRILQKEAHELFALQRRLEQHADSRIRTVYLWHEAPICSKAEALIDQAGWKWV